MRAALRVLQVTIILGCAGVFVCLEAFLEANFSWERGIPFHAQIVRITSTLKFPDRPPFESAFTSGILPRMLSDHKANLIPTAVYKGAIEVRSQSSRVHVLTLFVEPAFSAVFANKCLDGDCDTSHLGPSDILLSDVVAASELSGAAAVGKSIKADRLGELTIRGIFEMPSGRSHLDYRAIASTSARGVLRKNDALTDINASVYVRLLGAFTPNDLAALLRDLAARRLGSNQIPQLSLNVTPIAAIRVSPARTGDGGVSIDPTFVAYVQILRWLLFAYMILMLSSRSLDYMMSRLHDISVYHAAGRGLGGFLKTFLGHAAANSIGLVVVGFLFAVIVCGAQPAWIAQYDLAVKDLWSPSMIAAAVWLLPGTACLPLFVPASIYFFTPPVRTLAGGTGLRLVKSLQDAAACIQLSLACGLGLFTSLAGTQLHRLAHSAEAVSTHGLYVYYFYGIPQETKRRVLGFARTLFEESEFVGIYPGMQDKGVSTTHLEGRPDDELVTLSAYAGGPRALATLGVRLVAGRNLTPEDAVQPSGTTVSVICNMAATVQLRVESPERLLGSVISGLHIEGDDRPARIVGIFGDFRIRSLREPIEATCLYVSLPDSHALMVRMIGPGEHEALAKLDAYISSLFGGRSASRDAAAKLDYKQNRSLEDFFSLTFAFSVCILALAVLTTISVTNSMFTRLRTSLGILHATGSDMFQSTFYFSSGLIVGVSGGATLCGAFGYAAALDWLHQFDVPVRPPPELVVACPITGVLFLFFIIFLRTAVLMDKPPCDVLHNDA